MKKKIYIHIGGVYASREPTIINTVLGSCVAVCLFDPVKRIGGMNHIFLPGKADMTHFDTAARYGVNAMEKLINKMLNLGANRSRLVAKVFGGGHVISAISEENGVGQQNISFTLEFLRIEEIRVLSQNVGGTNALKIFFHTDTNDIFLKRIRFTANKTIAVEEKRRLAQARKAAEKEGEVTIFE